MPGSNPAAGSQPGPLPIIRHITPATDHYERGRRGQAVRWIVLAK